ncbi:MAG: SLBB domain-containing protein [Candidatus Latescibacterota bacterium]
MLLFEFRRKLWATFAISGIFSLCFISFSSELESQSATNVETKVEQQPQPTATPEQLKSMGIDPNNPTQAIERARQLGATEQQIQEAMKEYQQKQQTPQQQSPSASQAKPSPSKEPSPAEAIPPKEPDVEKTKQEQQTEQPAEKIANETRTKSEAPTSRFSGLRYYGYDVFERGMSANASAALVPLDPGYIIAPGDILRIIVWGEVEFQYDLEVGNGGNIVIPKIGPVFVAGTRYDKLESMLKLYISKFHSGLTSDPPTVFMLSTLAKLHNNTIYTMGEVRNPGMYQLPAYGTAFAALSAVGGPNVTGSLRNVQIIREGKVIGKIDFYDYLLKGTSNDDVRLFFNDVVFIPPRTSTIGIRGEVLRPAIYELKQNESLKDLIRISGGLKATAYTYRVQIDRIIPMTSRQKGTKERELIDIDIDDVMNDRKMVSLYDGDIVSVFPILESVENYVDISGAGIVRPGRYELGYKIQKLVDLIRAADGTTSDVYLNKVDIIRTNENLQEEFLEVNLEKAYKGDPGHDIALKLLDKVRVYSINEMLGNKTISIQGFAKLPGTYPYADNLTLYDVIFKYAGLQDTLRLKQTFLERGDIYRLSENAQTRYLVKFNLKDVWSKSADSNIKLQQGDNIIIYSNKERIGNPTFTIGGYISRPGTYQLLDNMTLYDILFTYSGLQDTTRYQRTYLERGDIMRLADDAKTQFTIPFNVKDSWNDKNSNPVQIKRGDKIFLYEKTIQDYVPQTVQLLGYVKKPGTYSWKQNMTLADLIIEGNGFTYGADLYTIEIDIVPTGESKTDSTAFVKQIKFNYSYKGTFPDSVVTYLLSSHELTSTIINPQTIVFIRKNPDTKTPRFVTINGEVNKPGQYIILLEGKEVVFDLIKRAGGITKQGYIGGATIERNGVRVAVDFEKARRNRKNDIFLLPGDVIFIPPRPNTIFVQGEIINPAFYKYYHGMNVIDYVKLSGGKTENGGKTIIKYATGELSRVSFFNNPQVKDGSIITVMPKPPKKEKSAEKKSTDWGNVVKESTAILSSALMVVYLSKQLQ